MGDTKGVPQIPADVKNGNTKVLVAELHWWTRDFEIESVAIEYGEVKEIYFFNVAENGRCKGHCKVEFYDPAAASACKSGMNGHIFNGRPCVVEFYSPKALKQRNAAYTDRILAQAQAQAQARPQPRDPVNHNNYFARGNQAPGSNMGGWEREEHAREDNASEYGSLERVVRPSAASLERDRNCDGERYDRDSSRAKEKDRESRWDKGQSSGSRRSRSSARDRRSQPRDADDRRRRWAPSE